MSDNRFPPEILHEFQNTGLQPFRSDELMSFFSTGRHPTYGADYWISTAQDPTNTVVPSTVNDVTQNPWEVLSALTQKKSIPLTVFDFRPEEDETLLRHFMVDQKEDTEEQQSAAIDQRAVKDTEHTTKDLKQSTKKRLAQFIATKDPGGGETTLAKVRRKQRSRSRDEFVKQRNRDAAERSRQKSKAHEQQLVQQHDQLEDDNRQLVSEIAALKEQKRLMEDHLKTCSNGNPVVPHLTPEEVEEEIARIEGYPGIEALLQQ